MERHTKDSEHGLDSRWSWIVSGFCCWAMLTSTLSVRAGGVIFAQFVQSFDVTREEASTPLSAQFISYYLSAIFYGYLIEAYSCRAVFLACTLTASVSISLCYFAPSLAFITFFFGVLHGGSLTGIAMSTLTILCQHFKRWQATACSLTLSSAGVSVFFVPQLISYCITMYGTLEAFLLLGAMTLNTLPAVIILRSPPWLSRCQRSTFSSGEPQELGDYSRSEVRKSSLTKVVEPPLERGTFCSQYSNIPTNEEIAAAPQALQSSSNHRNLVSKRVKLSCLKHNLNFIFTVTFLVDALSVAVQLYVIVTFVVVHVDLAQDRGVPPDRGIYLQHVHTVGDLALRCVAAFALDREYVRLETLMAVSFLGTAIACEALAASASFESLLLSSLILGLSEGLIASLPPILLLKDFREYSLPMTMGAVGFISGLILMTKPALFGYFRDYFGKYDGVLHTLAAVNGLLCTVWIFRRARLQRALAAARRLASL